MANNAIPIPPGAWIQVGLPELNGGAFLPLANQKLAEVVRNLVDYELASQDRTQKAKLVIELTVQRPKGAKELMTINAKFKMSSPCPQQCGEGLVVIQTAKQPDGSEVATDVLMLCQPAAGTNDDPRQMVLFDRRGRVTGKLDPESGELSDAGPVAGVIRRAAQ